MLSPTARSGLSAAARVAQGAIAALLIWVAWREPRGFDVFSAEFVAHQVLLPGLVLNALLATFASRRVAAPATVLQWAVFAMPALLLVTVASADSLRVAGVLVTLAAVAVFVIADLSAQETRARQRSALVAGLLVGGLFVLLLRAPSASTRPKFTLGEASTLTSEPVAPSAAADSADPVAAVEHHLVLATAEPLFTGPTLRVSLADELVIEHSDRTLRVNPVLQIDSASAHCLWSIIDYENETPEPWRVAQIGAQSWLIATESRSVSNRTRLTIEGERVTLNVSNTVEREVCVHLAQLLTVSFPRRSDDSAQLEVAGHTLHAGPVREALAWRHGEFALLRAEQDEKGPFETLALLPDPDPAFNADGLKFQVAGFAEQASHEASPTAGWGVSQGAIEVVGRSLFWELAATSIGRGWSTVRISPGTYELTLTLEPAP